MSSLAASPPHPRQRGGATVFTVIYGGFGALDAGPAHGQAGDLQGRLADAHGDALAVLAADADAGVEAEVVADQGHAGQRRGAVADQGRALDRRRHLAVLDEVGLGALE